jgi:hypothetical protein
MDLHWEQGSRAGERGSSWLVLEEGHRWSDLSPPPGAVAHVMELPYPSHPYQVTWLGQASAVQDFVGRPSEQYATQDAAIDAVETTLRAAGHTIDGV